MSTLIRADTEVGPYIAGLESPAYPLYLKKWGTPVIKSLEKVA